MVDKLKANLHITPLLCRLEDDWEEFADLVSEIEADQNHKEIRRIEVTIWSLLCI